MNLKKDLNEFQKKIEMNFNEELHELKTFS